MTDKKQNQPQQQPQEPQGYNPVPPVLDPAIFPDGPIESTDPQHPKAPEPKPVKSDHPNKDDEVPPPPKMDPRTITTHDVPGPLAPDTNKK